MLNVPKTQLKQDMIHHNQRDGGLEQYRLNPGADQPSTREDSWRSYAARPPPAHSCQSGQPDGREHHKNHINRGIEGLEATLAAKKNKDLVEILHDAPHARNLHSVWVEWWKRHAKQQQIDKGIATLRDKKGNDRADNMATKALLLLVETSLALTDHYVGRVCTYHNVLSLLQMYLCDAIGTMQKLRDNISSDNTMPRGLHTKHMIPITLRSQYLPEDHRPSEQPWAPTHLPARTPAQIVKECINQLEFIPEASIQHGDGQPRPTQWSEMPIACEMQTQTVLPRIRDHNQLRLYHSRTSATYDNSVIFKHLVQLAIQDLAGWAQRGLCQHLIKPVRRSGVHFKHLNIITAIAAIGPTMCVDPEPTPRPKPQTGT